MKKTVLALMIAVFASTAYASDYFAIAEVGSVSISNGGVFKDTTSFTGGVGTVIPTELPVKVTTQAAVTVFPDVVYTDTTGKLTLEQYAFQLSAKAAYPLQVLDGKLSVNGEMGMAYNQASLTGAGGYTNSSSAGHTQLLYGVGVAYDVTEQVAVTARYLNLGKFKATSTAPGAEESVFSVGVSYRF